MKASLVTVALLTSFAFAACSSKHHAAETGSDKAGAGSAAAEASADGRVGGLAIADPHRKVIRTGRIELVVATYDDARTQLDKLLETAGGYVDSTQVQHYQGAVSSATLVLRIPQDAFGQLLPKLEGARRDRRREYERRGRDGQVRRRLGTTRERTDAGEAPPRDCSGPSRRRGGSTRRRTRARASAWGD